MRSRLINSLLIAAAIVVALVAGEAALQVLDPPPAMTGAGTYNTPKARIYGWAYPPNATIPAHDPDTGEVVGFDSTNTQGWKDVEHEFAKPPGTYRILVLGDSYTWGAVPLDDLYTRQLEAILHARGHDDVEVISMGLPGWDVTHALVAFETEGRRYDPDLVIYQNTENDLYPLVHGMNDVSEENMDEQPWLWPFKFVLGDDGKAVKVDLGDRFERGLARRRDGSVAGALVDLLRGTAIAHHLVRAADGVRAFMAERFGIMPAQVEQTVMQPVFGNLGTADRRRFEPLDAAYFEDYRKRFREQVKAQLSLVRSIEAGETSQRISMIAPIEEPFVYRDGPFSDADERAWRLMEALLVRFRDAAADAGARFAVFTEDGGEGKRAYYRRVGNVVTRNGRDYALWDGTLVAFDWRRGVRELQAIGARNGIPVIPRARPYPRFVYDNHTNADGNRNMALDIADFLEAWPPFAEAR